MNDVKKMSMPREGNMHEIVMNTVKIGMVNFNL